MKRRIIAVAALVLLATVLTVSAGGDKNQIQWHGDNGQGSVVQNQFRINDLDAVLTIVQTLMLSQIP